MKQGTKALNLGLVALVCFFLANARAYADYIYVASGNNTIEKFDSSGTDLGVFANSGLNLPRGLAFDSSGNLYAANGGDGTIAKFDANGNGSLFDSGLYGLSFIAIQVPEPATWSLLALGVGALLGGCRLRRRSS